MSVCVYVCVCGCKKEYICLLLLLNCQYKSGIGAYAIMKWYEKEKLSNLQWMRNICKYSDFNEYIEMFYISRHFVNNYKISEIYLKFFLYMFLSQFPLPSFC